jgi:hypothetical protein
MRSTRTSTSISRAAWSATESVSGSRARFWADWMLVVTTVRRA